MSTGEAILYGIEVENFKTYAGKVRIGPFKPFTAVIGPNGSGKSNFIDAISFALGEKASKLRVKHLSDLIHGAHIGKPVSESASVTLCFKYKYRTKEGMSLLDEDITIFKRVVSRTGQKYILNNEPVTSAKYFSEVNALGLNVKGENFLVYQGKVESIALMDPKQRAVLFEENSGSKAFKREYDDLKMKMNNAVESSHSAFLKQRSFRNEYQEAKLEQGEARKYEDLLKELTEKRVELHLFKLFYNEKSITELEEEKSQKEIEMEEIQSNIKESEEKLKHAKKSFGVASRELAELESQVQDKEKQLKKVKLPFIKAKEEVTHLTKKLETAQSSLKQAEDVQKKHKDTLKGLKTELANVRREQQEYLESVTEESVSQGRDIELEESQARDYNELKRHAAHLSGSLHQQVESLGRELKAHQDSKENEMRKCSRIQDEIVRRNHKKDECNKRCEKLRERIRSNEKDLEELSTKQKSFESDISCHENIVTIQQELSQINAELNDVHSYKHEGNKKITNQRVVERLKELFPGVFDRLKSLCEPVHKKYAIALTRVMGRHMQAIVVDKESTARLCIQYLREQMLDAETFLPLDYLDVKPLKEHLREVGKKQTHLLFDVLTFNPPEVKKAVLFATRSVLVCETPEDAMETAFHNPQKMMNAVALDGTYYQKSGLISGGTADLARKAKQWDDKQVAQMQAQKTHLSEKLKDLLKQSRCRSELNTVNCQVDGYKSRIKLMNVDLEKSISNIQDLDEKLAKSNKDLEASQAELNKIEQTIEEQRQELKTLEKELHKMEDEVFSEFCTRIGVPNIRIYEKAGLKSFEERENKRMEFEDHKNRIKTQLEYEKTVDTDANIERWNDEVQRRRDALTTANQLVENQKEAMDTLTNELTILNDSVKDKRNDVGTLEIEVDSIKKDVKAIGDTLSAKKKQMLTIEVNIGNLQRARHSILIHCCIEGIKLPILEGDVNSLLPGGSHESVSSSSSSVPTDSQATSSDIVVDYKKLASNLKKLKSASIKEHETSLNSNIAKLCGKLMSMGAMNLKFSDKLEETSDKLRETNNEIDEARKRARKTTDAFEKVKKLRCDSFLRCFDFVSNEIDSIYKQLTKSTSAIALLTAENVEEPYLGGISYCCIAPGKPCKPMESLSGGEKTIASIALVIALHRFGNAPCLILDEVDAALDTANLRNVAEFFNSNKHQFHTIAISLQPQFYAHADALVGVTVNKREGKDDPESVVFLFDLEPYGHEKNN